MTNEYFLEMLKYEIGRLSKCIGNIQYQIDYVKDYVGLELEDFDEIPQIHNLYLNMMNKIDKAKESLEQQEKENER